MVKISLCIIARDEEKNIGRCLTSVAGVVDEIIVIDTGSTDNTCQIAKEYGAKVQSFIWNDNFSDARNAALDLATGEWILILDADEELARESGPVLRKLLDNQEAEGYFMKIVNYTGVDGEVEVCPDVVFRIFRNRSRYRFHGAIHEQIMDAIVAAGNRDRCILAEELVIVHYGYLASQIEEKKKKERNLSLIRKELVNRPNDKLLRYHYGIELHRAGLYEKAAGELIRAAEGLDPRTVYLPKLLRYIVISYYNARMFDQALQAADYATGLYPDYADIYYYGGLTCYACKEYGRAYRFFEKAAATPEQSVYFASFSGTRGFRAEYYLGQLAEAYCNEEEALRHYINSLRDNPSFKFSLEAVVRILSPRENPADVKQSLERVFDFSSPAAKHVLIQILFRQSAFPLALEYIEEYGREYHLPAEMAIWQTVCLMQGRRFLEALRLLDGFTADNHYYPVAKFNKLVCFWLQKNRPKVRKLAEELSELGLAQETAAVVGLLRNSLNKKKGPAVSVGDEGMGLLTDIIGRCLDLGETEQAVNLLAGLNQQCISDNSLKIGELLYQYDYPDLAAEYLGITARKTPQSAKALSMLAAIKEKTGCYIEAEGYYRQAISFDPKEPCYYIRLAKLYETMRRQVLEQAKGRYGESAIICTLLEEGKVTP